MYQDSRGYLWSGGSGGLSRFDGRNFSIFDTRNGLNDRTVNAIREGAAGRLFIGTNAGLSIMENGHFKNYGSQQGFDDVRVTAFCPASGSDMYIGTARGLYLCHGNSFSRIGQFDDFRINCLLWKDSSTIYAGTDRGLVIYSAGKFEIIDRTDGLPSDKINCIAPFREVLALGTDGGLCFYDHVSGKSSNYHIGNGLIDEEIAAVGEQPGGLLWVGSRSGLLSFDGQQFRYYNVGNDNNSNNITRLLRDREGNLWLGTHSGLFRYRDNSFSTFDRINGPGGAFIYAIFRDRQGDLWICTNSSGVFRYSQGYFKKYGIRDGLVTNTCRGGIEDPEGRLLFGTQYDVCQFKNNRFQNIPLPPGFKGPFETFFIDSRKRVWITGGNGVGLLSWEKNKPSVRFIPIPSQAELTVFGLCEGANGDIYVGTFHDGLYRLSGDSMIHLSDRIQPSESDFFSLRYLRGWLFAPTLNGLLALNTRTNKARRISWDEGLNSGLAYSIEFAQQKKYLWIGTNQGINRLDLKKFLQAGMVDIRSFGKEEGFAGVECNTNGIWEDADGTLWFGTVNGLVRHEPSEFKVNTVENSTIIERVVVEQHDTLPRDGLSLSHDQNSLSFYYRGICLTNPAKVLYQKKLEGLESDWSKPGPEDYSKYANLAPGRYTFRVRSCNNEGIWNSKDTSFTFEIRTPFYLTWWFRIAAVLLLFAVIYLVFIARVYYIRRRQKADFDRKVEMSRVELKALRSQMNPHFVFNSLNSIQHYIFHNRSEEAIKYLSKFARLVRIILNNSDKPTVTVGEDIETLRLYVELEQMRFEDKFEYEIVIDESVDPDYDIMPPLLMQPYVENAILHGLNPMPVRGKLTIRLNSENNFLICTITDNGIGREKAAEIKRTMPFSRHRSLGMKITEDRLRLLNAITLSQLSVIVTDLKNAEGEALGTEVKLFVPLNG